MTTTMTLIYLTLLSIVLIERFGLKVKFKTNEKLMTSCVFTSEVSLSRGPIFSTTPKLIANFLT